MDAWEAEPAGLGWALRHNGAIAGTFLDEGIAKRAAACLNAYEGYPAPPPGMMEEIVGTLKAEPCSCHSDEICRRCKLLNHLS